MNTWISVEERLPDGWTDVLVFDGVRVGAAKRYLFNQKRWWWTLPSFLSGIEAELDLEEPTHWMPLPEPPTIVEQASPTSPPA